MLWSLLALTPRYHQTSQTVENPTLEECGLDRTQNMLPRTSIHGFSPHELMRHLSLSDKWQRGIYIYYYKHDTTILHSDIGKRFLQNIYLGPGAHAH